MEDKLLKRIKETEIVNNHFRNLEKGLEVKPSPFYHFEDLQYLISYLFLVRAFRMKSAGIINTAIRRAMI